MKEVAAASINAVATLTIAIMASLTTLPLRTVARRRRGIRATTTIAVGDMVVTVNKVIKLINIF